MDKPLSGLRILVVEDEMMLLMFIEELLTDSGGIVATGSTVDDALSLIAARSFDVGVLDLNLKGTLSYPVADALRARNVPFLFATGYGKAAIRAPFCDSPVLQKPFDGNDLVQLVAGLSNRELVLV